MPEISLPTATPLVKWVGGKRQLQEPILNKILEVFNPREGTYFEPFFGGGAIFFALSPSKAVASDINTGLVNLYEQVKCNLPEFIELLTSIEETYNSLDSEEQIIFYVSERARFNEKNDQQVFQNRAGVEGAVLFQFLNKAGFNGMYRENSKGCFNIPSGKRLRLSLVDEANLHAVSRQLKFVDFYSQSFEDTALLARPGDFVYFDPPYAPISKTSFESYHSSNLGGFDQSSLKTIFDILTERGVFCLMSNSSAGTVETLFGKDSEFGYRFKDHQARRSGSASVKGRRSVDEVLVDNFQKVLRGHH